jgi:hypothetical protein
MENGIDQETRKYRKRFEASEFHVLKARFLIRACSLCFSLKNSAISLAVHFHPWLSLSNPEFIAVYLTSFRCIQTTFLLPSSQGETLLLRCRANAIRGSRENFLVDEELIAIIVESTKLPLIRISLWSIVVNGRPLFSRRISLRAFCRL